MVPHLAGQVGLESMKFRSEATGSNHFSALSANPMVSGPVDVLFGSIFEVEMFKIDFFKIEIFTIVFFGQTL